MSHRRLEWAAGLFDGEGSIGAYQYGTSLRLVVQLSMTHEKSVRLFKVVAGGLGSIHRRLPDGVNHKKVQWQYAVHGQQAAQVLRELEPFLFTKKSQARLLLRLANEMVLGTNRLTPAAKARRCRLIDKLKKEK